MAWDIFYQEGGTIQGFETPNMILGTYFEIPKNYNRGQGRQMWVFYTRRGQEDVRGISYQELGAIQGFDTPIRIQGILKKYLPPRRGGRGELGGQMWVFYTRRGKGDARGISYLEVGAIQGFENPIRILGFSKKLPPQLGSGGANWGSK